MLHLAVQYIESDWTILPRVVLTVVCLACVGPPAVHAQAEQSLEREIRVDGRRMRTVDSPDTLAAVAGRVADSLRRAGYYYAGIDSISQRTAHLSRGPAVHIGDLHLTGVDGSSAARLRNLMETREGTVLDLDRLEKDLQAILTYYERTGHPLAEAVVEELRLASENPPRIGLSIRVSEGPAVHLKRIELPGAERTRPSFVALLAGLEVGRPLVGFNPDDLQQRLEDSGLFESVGPLELVVDEDSAAVLRVFLKESDPGNFDLVLGYLPTQSGGGSFIGTGHLELTNLFGRGMALALRLNRLPNQASSVEARASHPFLFSLPLGIHGRFNGLEQDSTYGKQAYKGELSYRFTGGLGIFGGFSREVTNPGQAGLRLSPRGRQVIPKSDAWFLGIGIRFSRLDRVVNPTRGFLLESNLETGRKERSEHRVIDADTTREIVIVQQERLQATGRAYIPTLRRQVLVIGGDAGVLVSREYDRSDLFRFGGATSLRGYDEDRFLGRVVGRALIEYRFLIDRVSFAYTFVDLGFVDRPETPDLSAERDLHPGYGFGIQFRTAVGIVNVSAALNPESGPTDARIHAGLSFGL